MTPTEQSQQFTTATETSSSDTYVPTLIWLKNGNDKEIVLSRIYEHSHTAYT